MRKALALACMAAATISLNGCYKPGGAFLPYTGAPQTYYSTESSPKSVTLVDVRTNEIIFSIDIPVGQQLTMDFVAGSGDDPVHTPDLMRYQLWPIGTTTGRMRNAMTVPNAWARRVDIDIRDSMEYAPTPPDYKYRADDAGERPDWWTPKGGAYEQDSGLTIYD